MSKLNRARDNIRILELHGRQGGVDNDDEQMKVDVIHEAAINALAGLTASSIQVNCQGQKFLLPNAPV